LESTWRKYKEQGLMMVGVGIQDKEANAREFMRRFKFTFPNGPDPGSKISIDYGVYGVPETFFIDRQGRIAYKHVGALTPELVEEQVRAIFAKFRSGQTPTPEERAILQKIRSQSGFTSGNRQRTRTTYGAGASYIVFVLRGGKPTPVAIRTGLTDLDYSEVLSGLSEGDSVLILPSASLVKAQQDFQSRIGRLTGGGLPGLRQQSGSQGTSRGQ
jgi:hypothetical protein